MIELFVDSSVWIDFFADRGTWQVQDMSRRLLAGEQIGLTDVVFTELLQGARDDGDLTRLESYLAPLVSSGECTSAPPGLAWDPREGSHRA